MPKGTCNEAYDLPVFGKSDLDIIVRGGSGERLFWALFASADVSRSGLSDRYVSTYALWAAEAGITS